MSTRAFELPKQPSVPFAVEVLVNPTQAQLRELALEHTPFCEKTAHGNLNKNSRNKSRMAEFTYVIDRSGTAGTYSHQTIDAPKANAVIAAQADYIRSRGKMIAIEGYVGLGDRAVPVQWLYTLEGANIAGMQQILAFSREEVETPEQLAKPFEPAFRLIYTPDFRPDLRKEQGIVVDLDNYVTYVMGCDYFGESKKGALRMLAAFVYRNGGLLMHSGAKTIELESGSLVMGVLGLSGTGKTTTTFSRQGKVARPVQDDMIAIWPHGDISVTENGCFAKTYGLTEDSEPVIYRGTLSPSAWIENVYVDEHGKAVFDKDLLTADDVKRMRTMLIGTGAPEHNVDAYIRGELKADEVIDNGIPHDGWDFVMWTENGRSIIPMSAIGEAANLHDLPKMRSLGILNRDEGPDAAMPGLVRFTNPAQAAAYMMLGETSKTSAAGKERGKTRSPFTQPFFPLAHSLQAARFNELAATFPATTMWLMNTGYVGGDARSVEQGEGMKVKIRHSSAMLEALVTDRIKWTIDPDFGYEIVDVDAPENAALLDVVPREILQPKRYYQATNRMDEYDSWVKRMKAERRAFLEKYGCSAEIVAAVS